MLCCSHSPPRHPRQYAISTKFKSRALNHQVKQSESFICYPPISTAFAADIRGPSMALRKCAYLLCGDVNKIIAHSILVEEQRDGKTRHYLLYKFLNEIWNSAVRHRWSCRHHREHAAALHRETTRFGMDSRIWSTVSFCSFDHASVAPAPRLSSAALTRSGLRWRCLQNKLVSPAIFILMIALHQSRWQPTAACAQPSLLRF